MFVLCSSSCGGDLDVMSGGGTSGRLIMLLCFLTVGIGYWVVDFLTGFGFGFRLACLRFHGKPAQICSLLRCSD